MLAKVLGWHLDCAQAKCIRPKKHCGISGHKRHRPSAKLLQLAAPVHNAITVQALNDLDVDRWDSCPSATRHSLRQPSYRDAAQGACVQVASRTHPGQSGYPRDGDGGAWFPEDAGPLPRAGVVGGGGAGTNPIKAMVAAGGCPVILISDSRSSRSFICLLLGTWHGSLLGHPFYRLYLAPGYECAESVGRGVVPAVLAFTPHLL